ncbi:hypothetical protein RCL1_003551 [Eukaryota sp. TZLM3-RCL]
MSPQSSNSHSHSHKEQRRRGGLHSAKRSRSNSYSDSKPPSSFSQYRKIPQQARQLSFRQLESGRYLISSAVLPENASWIGVLLSNMKLVVLDESDGLFEERFIHLNSIEDGPHQICSPSSLHLSFLNGNQLSNHRVAAPSGFRTWNITLSENPESSLSCPFGSIQCAVSSHLLPTFIIVGTDSGVVYAQNCENSEDIIDIGKLNGSILAMGSLFDFIVICTTLEVYFVNVLNKNSTDKPRFSGPSLFFSLPTPFISLTHRPRSSGSSVAHSLCISTQCSIFNILLSSRRELTFVAYSLLNICTELESKVTGACFLHLRDNIVCVVVGKYFVFVNLEHLNRFYFSALDLGLSDNILSVFPSNIHNSTAYIFSSKGITTVKYLGEILKL